MTDKFEQYADTLESPFTNGVDVTPDDNNDLPQISRAIYLDEAGAVKVTLEGGYETTYEALTVGVHHPIRVKRVHATGTVSTKIKVVW